MASCRTRLASGSICNDVRHPGARVAPLPTTPRTSIRPSGELDQRLVSAQVQVRGPAVGRIQVHCLGGRRGCRPVDPVRQLVGHFVLIGPVDIEDCKGPRIFCSDQLLGAHLPFPRDIFATPLQGIIVRAVLTTKDGCKAPHCILCDEALVIASFVGVVKLACALRILGRVVEGPTTVTYHVVHGGGDLGVPCLLACTKNTWVDRSVPVICDQM
mmetsp:Transcript_67115/g.196263  ORF Transcript_67115/g.196263 Transcript_67115/m.196263 type:complete len:214 (-) Transcript_67115:435-1076(-)